MWADCQALSSVAQFKKRGQSQWSGVAAQSPALNVPNCDCFNWLYQQKFSL